MTYVIQRSRLPSVTVNCLLLPVGEAKIELKQILLLPFGEAQAKSKHDLTFFISSLVVSASSKLSHQHSSLPVVSLLSPDSNSLTYWLDLDSTFSYSWPLPTTSSPFLSPIVLLRPARQETRRYIYEGKPPRKIQVLSIGTSSALSTCPSLSHLLLPWRRLSDNMVLNLVDTDLIQSAQPPSSPQQLRRVGQHGQDCRHGYEEPGVAREAARRDNHPCISGALATRGGILLCLFPIPTSPSGPHIERHCAVVLFRHVASERRPLSIWPGERAGACHGVGAGRAACHPCVMGNHDPKKGHGSGFTTGLDVH